MESAHADQEGQSMAVNPSSLTTDQLNTFIKARLVISGIDLNQFPTAPDPVTGAPTQDQVLASMRSFILTNPAAINTWRPIVASAAASDAPRLSLMLDPPLEYPSITEAWADHVSTG
jgi:hypothetical protein